MPRLIFTRPQNKCVRWNFAKTNAFHREIIYKLKEKFIYIVYSKKFRSILYWWTLPLRIITHECDTTIKYYDSETFSIAHNWNFLYFVSYNKDRLFNRIIIIKKCFCNCGIIGKNISLLHAAGTALRREMNLNAFDWLSHAFVEIKCSISVNFFLSLRNGYRHLMKYSSPIMKLYWLY